MLTGCINRPPNEPPSPPVVLPHLPDTSLGEQGIDAVTQGDWIQVQWLPNQEDDLAFYRVYRFSYDDDQDIKLSVDSIVIQIDAADEQGDTITWNDQGVSKDIRYYYYIRAFDNEKNKSEPSGLVHYKLIQKVSPTNMLTPRITCSDRVPVFTINDLSIDTSPMQYIIIKVLDINIDRIIWSSNLISRFNPAEITYNYNQKALAGNDSLVIGRKYWWRLDALGREENSGSESDWVEFKVISD